MTSWNTELPFSSVDLPALSTCYFVCAVTLHRSGADAMSSFRDTLLFLTLLCFPVTFFLLLPFGINEIRKEFVDPTLSPKRESNKEYYILCTYMQSILRTSSLGSTHEDGGRVICHSRFVASFKKRFCFFIWSTYGRYGRQRIHGWRCGVLQPLEDYRVQRKLEVDRIDRER